MARRFLNSANNKSDDGWKRLQRYSGDHSGNPFYLRHDTFIKVTSEINPDDVSPTRNFTIRKRSAEESEQKRILQQQEENTGPSFQVPKLKKTSVDSSEKVDKNKTEKKKKSNNDATTIERRNSKKIVKKKKKNVEKNAESRKLDEVSEGVKAREKSIKEATEHRADETDNLALAAAEEASKQNEVIKTEEDLKVDHVDAVTDTIEDVIDDVITGVLEEAEHNAEARETEEDILFEQKMDEFLWKYQSSKSILEEIKTETESAHEHATLVENINLKFEKNEQVDIDKVFEEVESSQLCIMKAKSSLTSFQSEVVQIITMKEEISSKITKERILENEEIKITITDEKQLRFEENLSQCSSYVSELESLSDHSALLVQDAVDHVDRVKTIADNMFEKMTQENNMKRELGSVLDNQVVEFNKYLEEARRVSQFVEEKRLLVKNRVEFVEESHSSFSSSSSSEVDVNSVIEAAETALTTSKEIRNCEEVLHDAIIKAKEVYEEISSNMNIIDTVRCSRTALVSK